MEPSARKSVWEGFFASFRDDGGPTLYPAARTAVTVDILEAGFVYAGAILAISLLFLLPGIRSCGQKCLSLLKIFIVVFITLVIFLCNFGQEWEVGYVQTRTPYRAGSRREIKAEIGVRIGLRSINITLKGTPEHQRLGKRVKEQINYNERFDWSADMWQQGKIGFGPFASHVNLEYRRAQYHGTPYPILWIAEYFTIDGEGIRWGRFYHQAGFYAHILLWLAFPLWVLTLILFQYVMFYGVVFCILTGACHVIAVCLYAIIRNPTPLRIPFENGMLECTWGWTFYLCLANGIICVLFGIIVFILEIKSPETVARFFGVDTLVDYEEYYLSSEELAELGFETDSMVTTRNTDTNNQRRTEREDRSENKPDQHLSRIKNWKRVGIEKIKTVTNRQRYARKHYPAFVIENNANLTSLKVEDQMLGVNIPSGKQRHSLQNILI